jgi:hypothetical protein
MLADPDASNRTLAGTIRPPRGISPARRRRPFSYASGDLVPDPMMLAMLDGKPTGGALEALLERRRQRLRANR